MAWKAKKPMTAEMAMARLEAMCARAEHCRFELRQKLVQWQVPGHESDAIIESLEKRRFFDDARYASAFCRHKALFARWGKRKILMALRAKRIETQMADDALAEIDEEEYRSVMIDLLRSKAASLKEGNTFDGRTKLYRFGIQRGYEPALVAAAIRAGVLWPGDEEE